MIKIYTDHVSNWILSLGFYEMKCEPFWLPIFFLLTLSTQDPILNRSFVNQSFILFALISSFFLFSPVQDPEQLTEEEEMKEEKPKMSHINSAITGFEKAFEQFATGGVQSHVTNPVSRPDILKDNKPDVGGFLFLIILVVSICSLYIYIKINIIHLLN